MPQPFFQQLNESVFPSADIAYRTIGSYRASYFAQNGQIAGNHRATAGHGFDDRKAKPFGFRGMHQ